MQSDQHACEEEQPGKMKRQLDGEPESMQKYDRNLENNP